MKNAWRKDYNLYNTHLFQAAMINESLSGNSSVGRAQPCQGWGREFETRFPLHHKDSARWVKVNQLFWSAGIAQLVERNLAKVEVASSRLVSRSKDLSSGRFEMRE